MKINYFSYFIIDGNTGKKYQMPLADVFDAFLAGASLSVKDSLKKHGENIFLMPTNAGQGMYLFGMTRSEEVIKRINMSNYTAEEIYSILDQGEHIGFASYLFPRSNFFAFGTTVMAPKFGLFVQYFNSLLDKIGLNGWFIQVSPLLQEVTSTDVFSMESVGRTTISLEKSNGFVAQILGIMNAGTQDYADLDGIDIVIKPKRRKSIKSLVQKLDTAIGVAGIEKYTIKAVEESQDYAMEYYLIGKGAIHDFIETKDESAILALVNKRISSNTRLAEKVRKYYDNTKIEPSSNSAILCLSDADAWGSVS